MFNSRVRHPLEVLEVWRKSVVQFRDAASRGDEDEVTTKSTYVATVGYANGQWQKPMFCVIKINTEAD